MSSERPNRRSSDRGAHACRPLETSTQKVLACGVMVGAKIAALSAEQLPWTAAFSLSLGARHIASTLAQGTYAVCALEYLADRPRVTVTDA